MAAVPMYMVIYRDLADKIFDGKLAQGERLPAEPALAAEYGVSRMTVRQALDQLTSQRLLVRRPGSGTFVAPHSSAYRQIDRLNPFDEGVAVDHQEISTTIQYQDVLQPPEYISERLRLKPQQTAIRLLRLRSIGAEPVAIQDSWLPYSIAPGLAREELIRGSLYRTLRERYGIHPKWAEQEITAAAAMPGEAKSLDVAVGCPLIAITRTTYADGPNPIEYATSLTRPEFPLRTRVDT